MGKFDGAKIGTVVLLLAVLGLAWPVYEKAMEDPMASLPQAAPGSAAEIRLNLDADEDSGGVKTGYPPALLFTWDPFKAPRVRPQRTASDGGDTTAGETQQQAAPPPTQLVTIPVDHIKILGIVSLNGEYLALLGGVQEMPVEVRRGQLVPGMDNVRVVSISRDGVMLTQPGAQKTFVPMSTVELIGQPWYGAVDTGAIRGRIEFRRR